MDQRVSCSHHDNVTNHTDSFKSSLVFIASIDMRSGDTNTVFTVGDQELCTLFSHYSPNHSEQGTDVHSGPLNWKTTQSKYLVVWHTADYKNNIGWYELYKKKKKACARNIDILSK